MIQMYTYMDVADNSGAKPASYTSSSQKFIVANEPESTITLEARTWMVFVALQVPAELVPPAAISLHSTPLKKVSTGSYAPLLLKSIASTPIF